MGPVIGMDIHRTFAEVVFWEAGRLRPAGRVDMTRSGLEGFGRTLSREDEVIVEATGNAMAVVRFPQSREAGELCGAEPTCAAIRPGTGATLPRQQAWPLARPRPTAGGGLVDVQGAWAAACVLPAYPGETGAHSATVNVVPGAEAGGANRNA